MRQTTLWIIVIVILVIAGFAVFTRAKPNGVTTPPLTSTSTAPQNDYTGWKTYASSTLGFSIKYPADFKVNDKYVYNALGPNKEIPGVAFIIPQSLATGTNLAADSYISVEHLNKTTCTISDFINNVRASSTITENGITYQVASSTGVGLGNYYEDIVYKLPGCKAIRYLIHSSNIQNYTPGTIKEFNHAALIALFDKIRRSYTPIK